MLICPQCQSENSDNNQFCSVCNTSLTHKNCDRCSATIPLSQEYCSHCGNFNLERRYGLIYLQAGAEENSLKVWQQKKYLDQQSRYRISEIDLIPTLQQSHPNSIEIFLTDTKPLAKSLLRELFAHSRFETQVSEIALPYLKLGRFEPNTNHIYAAIPQIYDAWHFDDRDIIVLEERSDWQMLSEFGDREDLSYLQILYWFDEMVQLWTILKDVRCTRSLLVEKNLRLDEDLNFCLQRLYYDDRSFNPHLQLLGKVWQTLLDRFDLLLPNSLTLLLELLIAGEIETTPKLRSQLQNIVKTEAEKLSRFSPAPENTSIAAPHIEPPTTILPLELVSLADAGETNIGSQRDCNEDFFAICSQINKQGNLRQQTIQARGLYLVCDGMGGHEAGEVASAMAVNILQEYFDFHWQDSLPDRETIRRGIHLANERIYQENINNSARGSRRMGTTLVMALVQNTKIAIASVGDSRLYSIGRKSGLKQLTPDHQVAQQEIRRGVDREIAYALPNAFQLTQALGPRDNDFVEPYIDFLELKEDCLLLLCSDGFYDNGIVTDRWQTYLKPLLNFQANLDLGLEKFIDLAARENGHDNITAILVSLKLRPLQEPSSYR